MSNRQQGPESGLFCPGCRHSLVNSRLSNHTLLARRETNKLAKPCNGTWLKRERLSTFYRTCSADFTVCLWKFDEDCNACSDVETTHTQNLRSREVLTSLILIFGMVAWLHFLYSGGLLLALHFVGNSSRAEVAHQIITEFIMKPFRKHNFIHVLYHNEILLLMCRGCIGVDTVLLLP